MLKPGESATLDVGGLKEGDYTLLCEVSGHEGAGMKAMLMVGIGGGAAPAGSASDAALTAADTANNKMMKKQIADYVGAARRRARTPRASATSRCAPTVLPDGTKEFDLTAKIVDWEVEPGKTVKAWTYNGTGARDR